MRARSTLGFLMLALVAVPAPYMAAQVMQPESPVRQIDHVMIRTGDPKALFEFFVDVLQLPIAWPPVVPRAGVTTAGVSFGNVNVEAIQLPGQADNRPRLVGLALEPSELPASLQELERRGITYGSPRPLVSKASDGSAKTLWTNVTLRQFSDSDSLADATVHIFLSEYSPAYVNVAERRLRLRNQLIAIQGGPLGVEAVQEVVIGVPDLDRGRALWQALLAPTPASASNAWQIGDGPAIRLAAAEAPSVQELVIRVTSLQRAKAFLRENGLLGEDLPGAATIDRSKLNGPSFRLVEAK
jgi:hypothetical protein